jgi:hypothetical protein
MDNNNGHAVNLKQYRRLNGKWQFVPVVKQNGKPNPKLVLINGEPVSSKGGIFYLDWRENGKRRTRPVGSSPREALDAGQLQSGIRAGEIEPEDEPVETAKGLTKFCCFCPLLDPSDLFGADLLQTSANASASRQLNVGGVRFVAERCIRPQRYRAVC